MTPVVSVAETLAAADIFASLSSEQCATLATGCGTRRYGKHELVFLRGDTGQCMYVVATGAVDVTVGYLDGREVLLAVLGPAQTFGELAVIDAGPRVATVRARSETQLVVVPRDTVTTLVDRHPAVARALLTALAAMVRRADEQACDASLLDLPGRVAKLLATAAATNVPRLADDDGFVSVDLPLTQTDMARRVGGSRQQVNRVLMALETSGSIKRLGHRVTAVRPDLLVVDI
jgi:CRP/FNR family cyclic AMP-dependent transcriptional regulator